MSRYIVLVENDIGSKAYLVKGESIENAKSKIQNLYVDSSGIKITIWLLKNLLRQTNLLSEDIVVILE